MLEQRIDGEDRWFLNAPIGRHSGLVIEIDERGRSTSAFFGAEYLSVEQRFGQAPTFFLEDGLVSATAAVATRVLHGRSLSEELGQGASTPSSVTIPQQLAQLAPPLQHSTTALELAGDLSYLSAVHSQSGIDPSGVLTDLGALKTVSAGLVDLAAFANSQGSLSDKLWRYGALGHTAEHLGGEAAKQFFESKAGLAVPGVGEFVGLGWDLARGHSLLSPEAMEHVLDLGFGAAVGAAVSGPMTALGQASHIPKVVDIATRFPDPFRTMLEAPAIRLGAEMARTGEDQTGQFIYQAASASLRGDLSRFKEGHGDIFSTVMGGRARPRAAYGQRRNAAYEAFWRAIERGDRSTAGQLLRDDPHLRRAVQSAGYTETHIAQMSEALASERPPVPVPGVEITNEARRLGGVDLAVDETRLPAIGRVRGAVLDPVTRRIALVGDGDRRLPSLDPELFAVALLAAYSPSIPDPRFSLDPIDPLDASSW